MSEGPTTDSTEIALDPNWIAQQMVTGRGGAVGATFDGFIGTGQMSRNARFTLDWVEGSGPASVVVKLPSGDPGTRAVAFEHGIYRRECRFYEAIAPLVDIITPGVHAAHLDEDGQDFGLILEDMSGSVQGDQFSEATVDELRVAIAQAAALHAPAWGRCHEEPFREFIDDREERAARAEEMMPFFHAVVLERLGDRLDADMGAMLDRFVASAGAITLARSEPNTLVHGDFRPDNFLVGVAEDAPALAIVDWQTVAAGFGIADVAYLIAGAVPPERRREIEPDLVEFYRGELASRGVDYADGECQRDYAIAALHGISIAVTATVMAEQTERGDSLFAQMINRHGRHALDLGALDLIEASA